MGDSESSGVGWAGRVGDLVGVLSAAGPLLVLSALRDDVGGVSDFRVDAVNAAGADVVGRPVEDLVGVGLAELGEALVDGSLFDVCRVVVDGGDPFAGVVEWFDGDRSFVDVRVTALGDGVVITGWDVTEARLAEQVLEVVDAAADAVMSIDLDDRFVYWSRAAERMYGWSAEEVAGQPVSLLAPEGLGEEQSARIAAALDGAVQVYETTRRRKDGTTFPVEITIAPVLDRSGRVLRTASVHRDITERIQAAAELAASEARLRMVVDNSRDAITLTRGQIVEWASPAIEDFLGVAADELVGQAVAGYIHPDDQPQVAAGRALLEVGTSFDACIRVHHRDGSWRWADVRIAPVGEPGPEGLRVTNWQSADERMAALAQLESSRVALAESERNYRLVVDNSRDAITVTLAGVLQWASPAFAEFTGVDPAELVGTQLIDRIHPDDRGALEATRARLVAGLGDGTPQQLRIRHTDGSWHWAELRTSALSDDSGAAIGAISNWRLVDDQVAYIEALARSEAHNRELAAQLQEALDSRVLLEQAKGMVAAQRSISPDEAFDVIRDHARRHGRKLRDAAHDIVHLGLRV